MFKVTSYKQRAQGCCLEKESGLRPHEKEGGLQNKELDGILNGSPLLSGIWRASRVAISLQSQPEHAAWSKGYLGNEWVETPAYLLGKYVCFIRLAFDFMEASKATEDENSCVRCP